MPPHLLARRILAVSFIGLIAASALFTAFSTLDLPVSGLFGSEGGFPVATVPFWIAVRYGFMVSIYAVLAWLIVAMILGRWFPRREALAGVLAYVLGSGLLVNGLLKAHWGRARPRDIVQFGGDRLFMPPLIPVDQCSYNCSFVSGEGSAVTTAALVLLLLFWGRIDRRGRVIASVVAVAYAGAGSWLRVAFGGHFLSDIIFAALLMGVLVPGIWLVVMGRGGPSPCPIQTALRPALPGWFRSRGGTGTCRPSRR
ncbi:MAG: phosphatase PAP2 family protein [Paracoccus sp. (in: a-proteobacteria)]|uniref:phosphatase PAP2 family protein n=1 Tax=Paracoccus sp. TaxID=267 RepID=UPI0026DEE56D|nr:phosphatase PAP2 family protein [Paracoccus sp. (in: a-proteobacteria)]MDO5622700.1 phosphatase PAP2 family protein [Paracoccus sp. (in: a-proteobacteria)]